jgi:hypothetical protein
VNDIQNFLDKEREMLENDAIFFFLQITFLWRITTMNISINNTQRTIQLLLSSPLLLLQEEDKLLIQSFSKGTTFPRQPKSASKPRSNEKARISDLATTCTMV